MRVLLLVGLSACSFHAAQSTDVADAGIDAAAARADAPRMIDAPTARIDAPDQSLAECLGQTTATFGGHHYFTTSDVSWQGAQNECAGHGGHLVTIEDDSENTFVTSTFANGFYTWIGLHDPSSTDTYVWADGSPLGSYNAFFSSPPTGTPDCVDSNGTWDTFTCTNTNHGGTCECE